MLVVAALLYFILCFNHVFCITGDVREGTGADCTDKRCTRHRLRGQYSLPSGVSTYTIVCVTVYVCIDRCVWIHVCNLIEVTTDIKHTTQIDTLFKHIEYMYLHGDIVTCVWSQGNYTDWTAKYP